MPRPGIIEFAAAAMAAQITAFAVPASPLHLVQTIPLPGVEGRIDHLAVDLATHRLFVCALGNDTLEVVDLEKGRRIQSVPGFNEPQGIVFMPKTKTVVVASGGDGKLSFL